MAYYNQNSRYYSCDTENNLTQDNFTKYNYEYDTTTVLANESGRLDLVSYRVYNTPVKWWIIARFNSIFNPETAIVGTELKIPRV